MYNGFPLGNFFATRDFSLMSDILPVSGMGTECLSFPPAVTALVVMEVTYYLLCRNHARV